VLLQGRLVQNSSVDVLIGLLLPLLMGSLKMLQPSDLIRAVDHAKESVEFGFDLSICLVQGLEEDRIADQEVASEAGFFIDHQFDQTVGVQDDHVRSVHCGCTFLNTLQTVTENDCQDSERCHGQGKEANQKPVIEPRIHSIFPLFVVADDFLGRIRIGGSRRS
jgi:hypothetical protein